MTVRNVTQYELTCDRCDNVEMVNFNPLSEDANSKCALNKLGWQFWGRVGYGTDQHLLCSNCVSRLKAFFDAIKKARTHDHI